MRPERCLPDGLTRCCDDDFFALLRYAIRCDRTARFPWDP